MNKKNCMNCSGTENLFELIFYDEEFNGEVYCNECLANILREDPTPIKSITRIEEA